MITRRDSRFSFPLATVVQVGIYAFEPDLWLASAHWPLIGVVCFRTHDTLLGTLREYRRKKKLKLGFFG